MQKYTYPLEFHDSEKYVEFCKKRQILDEGHDN